MMIPDSPPASCTRRTDPLAIAAVAIAAYAALRGTPLNNTGVAFLVCAAVTAVMSGLAIYRAPWRRTPRPVQPFAAVAKSAAVRWLGVMAGLAPAYLFWWLLRRDADFGCEAFFKTAFTLLPAVPCAVALWVLVTEWRLGPQEDGTAHAGRLLLGRWRGADWLAIRNAMMGWVVRAVFLPLNFSALSALVGRLRGHEDRMLAPWPEGNAYLLSLCLALLGAAIVPGYLFSARLTDTQIRKVDFTATGWLATLSCYPPLYYWVFERGLNFYPHMERATWGAPWAYELAGAPALAVAAGLVMLLLEILHYWGEAQFGLRASNLSNRGIITNGLFRYCKHPIYVVKCAGWLLWMPFLAGATAAESAWLTLMWAGTCVIFMMRAWVEERLLSDDPGYVAYGLWMDRHGLFAFMGRWLPLMRYEWRLERWRKEWLPG